MRSFIWDWDFIDSLRRSGCGRGGKYLMAISPPVPDLLSKPTRHPLREKSAQEFKKRDGVLQGMGSPLLLAQTGAIHHSEVGFCAALGGRKV